MAQSKTYMAPYGKISTKKEPIRRLEFPLRLLCHIIKIVILFNITFIRLLNLFYLNTVYAAATFVLPLLVRGAYRKEGAKSNY